jgi:tetratricopeptide (TPR) repeat protein
MRFFVSVFLAITVSVSAAACSRMSPDPPRPAQSSSAVVLPQPESAPVGFGYHHHPIRTASQEAQQLFDRGMAQAFGFNHEAAIRSFERASELDPSAAMPHWGRAWALGANYNLDIDDARAKEAYDAITKARSLAAAGPAVEREYIDALAVRYSPDMKADRPTLARTYSSAMEALSQRYPDDLDAATLYAESLMNLTPWKLWTLDGRPNENTERILATLESVLRRQPDHLAANHYYIHAVEASPNPGRALPSATRLGTLAENSGHLLHMPAHIYARTGDHGAAAAANAAGAAADVTYLGTAPPNGFYGMAYYSHNLHFLADSQMMQGRFFDAKQAADRVAEHLSPHAAMMPMVESMVVMPVSVLLRFGRYGDLLKLTEPPADRPVQRAWYHFARGTALARTAKADEAAAERKALTSAIASVPETALFGGTGLADARTVLGIAGTVLDARIAAARGESDRAMQSWRRAVAAVDLLPYDEPPVWFYPVRESLGAALLANNTAVDAERVFRDDLERHPRNARSLFGLQASLRKQGEETDAAWVQRQLEDAWKNADTKLILQDF